MQKLVFIVFAFLILFAACKGSEKLGKKTAKLKIELLYKVWDVDSIIVGGGGKAASGAEMGNPQYEFTKEGQRIKSFKSPPHSEAVSFFVRNDSIHYSSEKALPSSAITALTDSTLVLKNEKAVWKLYIKK
jgi:hypothetical protein